MGTCLRHVTDDHPRANRGLPYGLPEVTAIRSLTLPPPFLRLAPDRYYLAVEEIIEGLSWKGLGEVLVYRCI